MPKGRKRNSSEIHPERECGPCSVCWQTAYNYCHTKTWKEEARNKLDTHFNIMVDECICRRCEKEIKNNINKENYDPTWRREQQSYRKPLSCIVAGCTTTSSMIHSQKYNASKVAELIQVEVSRGSELTTTLCEEHYKRTQRLAKNYNVHKKCYMCHFVILSPEVVDSCRSFA